MKASFAKVSAITLLALTLCLTRVLPTTRQWQLSWPMAHHRAVTATKTQIMCERSATALQARHAYHNEPATSSLPKTLDPSEFKDSKAALVTYSIAAKIPELLYQEPCYCPCDEQESHTSLLDCYTSKHATACPACQMEVIFSYQQAKLGKTASEIRAAMDKGVVWKLDLDKYVDEHYAEYRQTLAH